MKFIIYELRKLAGVRYIWIFLLTLLAANVALAVYSCYEDTRYSVAAEKVDYIFGLYREDKDEVDADYEKVLELQDEQTKLWQEAIANGNYNFQLEQPPNKYFEDVSDSADARHG